MVIKLYDNSFSFENQQGISYPYDHSTKGLMKAIDSQRLLPDLIDILDENQCHYYDGCLVIELQDYRGKPTNTIPTVRKVLLKPDMETVIHDIQQLSNKSGKDWSQEDKLAVEQKILVTHHLELVNFNSLIVYSYQ